jgi:hypothetical protein
MKTSRRISTLLLVATVAVAVLAPITAAQATGPVGHTELVPDVPRLDTPRITSGGIEQMVQWGNRVILAGSFPGLADADGTPHAQPFLAAYDIDTGLVDATFAPSFDSFIEAIAVSADGNHLFVGGAFNTVNGENHSRIVKIDATGAVDPTFDANPNARVSALAVSSDGAAVYAGGFFSAVNGTPRGLLAKLDAATGAVDPALNLPITEGIGSGSTLKVQSLLLTPDNNTLVVVHTGRRVNGVLREGIALVNANSGALLPWQTDLYTDNLPRVGGVLRITKGDIDPTGTYFVVVSGSGGDRPPLNDTVIAWPVAGGTGTEPLWVSRHFDSVYSVAVTEHAVYTGGHFRWQEAPGSSDPWPGDTFTNYGWDAGVGAAALGDEVVRRDQIGALDPATGKAMNWNPGSNAFVGVQALTAVERGLLVYHDNTILGGYDVGYHGFFDWDSVVNPEGPQTNITDPFSGFTIVDQEVDVLGTAYAENDVNFVRVWVCQGPCYGQGADGPFLQPDRVSFAATPNSFDVTPDAPGGQNVTWGLTGLDLPSGTFEARARTFQVGGGNDASVASVIFDVDNDGDDPPITTIVWPSLADVETPPESNTFVIIGTAADDVGVAAVNLTVYLRDPADPNFGVLTPLAYLQDDGTLGQQYNTLQAEIDDPGAQVVNWELEVTLPFGDYGFTANATDTAGQQDNAFNLSAFILTEDDSDNEQPSATITSPFFFSEIPMDTSIDITGTASDTDGAVVLVEVVVQNAQTGSGMQPDGQFGPNLNWIQVPIAVPGPDVAWSLTTPPLPTGQYFVQARAYDNAGTRTDALLRPLVIFNSGVPGDAYPDTTLDWVERDQDVDSLNVAISGTATDDAGVDQVVVTIRETRARNLLQGRRYVTGAGAYDVLYTEIPAVLSGPATNRTWTLDGITLPEDGDYTITAKAVDTAGQYDIDQTGATTNWVIWPGDTDPYTWIQSPAPDASVPAGSVIIDGRAFDDLVPFCDPGITCGVRVVELQIRNSAGQYMDDLGTFGPVERWVEVFLTNPTGQFSNWNYATPELTDDVYTVTARAQDLRYQYDQDIQTTLTEVPGGEGSSLDQITLTVGAGVSADPELTLSVDADSLTFTGSGASIDEQFTLTNTGNVVVDGPFTVDTNQPGDPVTCPAIADLSVGASVVCTATNTITAGEVSAGQSVTVATGAGSYDGSTVTSNEATLTLTYDPPAPSEITYRAMTSLAKKGKWHNLTIPNQVQEGDVMLLFVTAAVSDEVIERPRRWKRIAMRDDTGLVSTVFWKVADADDAGSNVRVVLTDRRKTESVLIAYDGVDTANPVDVWNARRELGKSMTHRTAPATTATAGTMVLSYWGARHSSTGSLTAPGLSRYSDSMNGGAVPTVLLVETRSNAPVGTYGPVTATGSEVTGRAVMWTIALRAE